MGNFFDRENMLARVIAFLIACALWMYVMNEQNVIMWLIWNCVMSRKV